MASKQRYKVHHSTVLDAGPDAVWAELRDVLKMVKIIFSGGLGSAEWVEGGSLDRVPSRYNFTVGPDRDLFQQQVAGRDEVQRSVTYRSVAPVLCVVDYVATYHVREVTNDPHRSFLEWTRDVQVADDTQPEVVEAVLGMMAAQIDAVRDFFAPPDPSSQP
ncbi:SRPBCC family protein [Actinophytocola algeriensis]|uniref:Polyketide cyclase/dehydrase/lipid transport protein n=1 Tax=Actinophytocola algeriensis TaxID=1768010 RepID=A0A7W7Q138_9PSEU|nr:SRPBCC family protein [Actinophytocola algeriensis]MBB4905057.1 hypothetical protein [Actinophytocola algeriensis]MBE1473258.1 hypothetical protein [Actinophytocola algeriensis]